MADDLVIQLPQSVDPNLQLPDPQLLSFYEDKQNRIIWALKEIGDESYDWVSQIIDYNRSDRVLPVEQRKPIRIIIANYGGGLDEARMLREIIKLSKTPIYGVAVGMCASAASVLYLSCHKRFATNNATFLFHKGSCDKLGGNYSELVSFMDKYKADVEELTEFYVNSTKFSREEIIQHLTEGDWYVDVQTALKNGVVDEILTDLSILY